MSRDIFPWSDEELAVFRKGTPLEPDARWLATVDALEARAQMQHERALIAESNLERMFEHSIHHATLRAEYEQAVRAQVNHSNREGQMRVGHFAEHWSDEKGNPAGGVSTGRGFTVSWQNGPLGRDENRREPNGAFVEDVIEAVKQRIEFYQNSKFACGSNSEALRHLGAALLALDSRTKDRDRRECERRMGLHLLEGWRLLHGRIL